MASNAENTQKEECEPIDHIEKQTNE